MRRLLVSALAGTLCACSSIPSLQYKGMNEKEIKAAVGDKSVTIDCIEATGMWGKTRVVRITVDRGVDTGSLGAGVDCNAVFNGKGPQVPQ